MNETPATTPSNKLDATRPALVLLGVGLILRKGGFFFPDNPALQEGFNELGRMLVAGGGILTIYQWTKDPKIFYPVVFGIVLLLLAIMLAIQAYH